MTHIRRPWIIRLEANAARTIVRDRNYPIVIGLLIAIIVLTASGLLTDVWLGPRWLMISCYAAALLSGSALLAFLYSRRLRVARPPRP